MNFLLLHGLAGNPDDWKEVSILLKKNGHECFIPNIPYFNYNYNSLDILSEKLKLNIPENFLNNNSIIIGNSLGGSIALKLGLNTQKIILVASYTNTSTEWIGRGVKTLEKEIKRIFFDPTKLTNEKKEQYTELWLSFTKDKASFSKLVKIKKAIKQDDLKYLYKYHQSKIHLICGENDNLSPLSNFYKLKKKFPKLHIDKIKYCGHAIPIEKPKELSDIILSKL